MAINLEKLTEKDLENPKVLVEAMNGILGEYKDAIALRATKEDTEKLQAQLIVKANDLQEKITKQGDFWDEKKKEIDDLKETIKIQGATITKMKDSFLPTGNLKSLNKAIVEKIEGGVFDDWINKKVTDATFEINTKDVAFTGTYGSGAAQHAYMPFQVPQDPLLENFDVRMLLPTGIINSEKLDYPQERAASLTNATASASENGNSPESTFGFTMTTVNAKRITAFVEISKRAMKNSTWLASYINNRLMALLIQELNTQVIADTGAGTDINGLYNNANSFNAATSFSSVTNNASIFDVARAMMATMNSSYHINANSLLLNPIDAAIAAMTKSTIGEYVNPQSFLNASANGYRGAWGLNHVETGDITANTLLLAAINPAYMQLLFNGPIEITATNSHASNFIANLEAIKIECDVMLPIYNANALLKCTDVGSAKTTMTIGA